MKSLEDRKKKILESLINKIDQLHRQKCSSKLEEDYLIDQALSALNALDKPKIDEGINILIYKLRKNYREFGFDYYGIAKTLEISLWFFNVIVMWGNEEELNDKYR